MYLSILHSLFKSLSKSREEHKLDTTKDVLSKFSASHLLSEYISTSEDENTIFIQRKSKDRYLRSIALFFIGTMVFAGIIVLVCWYFEGEHTLKKAHWIFIYLAVFTMPIMIIATLIRWMDNKRWNSIVEIHLNEKNISTKGLFFRKTIPLNRLGKLHLERNKIYCTIKNSKGKERGSIRIAKTEELEDALLLYNLIAYFLPNTVDSDSEHIIPWDSSEFNFSEESEDD